MSAGCAVKSGGNGNGRGCLDFTEVFVPVGNQIFAVFQLIIRMEGAVRINEKTVTPQLIDGFCSMAFLKDFNFCV